MTDTTAILTPAENRARAADALRRASGVNPAAELHRNLLLAAIAHNLSAIAVLMEPPPAPQIPGLPVGYTLDVQQDPDGTRKWRYELDGPGMVRVVTRHRWDIPGTALAAGIQHANELAEGIKHTSNGTGH